MNAWEDTPTCPGCGGPCVDDTDQGDNWPGFMRCILCEQIEKPTDDERKQLERADQAWVWKQDAEDNKRRFQERLRSLGQ